MPRYEVRADLAEVEGHGPARGPREGNGRADGQARSAALGAARGVHAERAAVPVGERGGGPLRVRHRLAAASQPGAEGIEDEHGAGLRSDRGYRSWPQ